MCEYKLYGTEYVHAEPSRGGSLVRRFIKPKAKLTVQRVLPLRIAEAG
jgi:hypothetical protein